MPLMAWAASRVFLKETLLSVSRESDFEGVSKFTGGRSLCFVQTCCSQWGYWRIGPRFGSQHRWRAQHIWRSGLRELSWSQSWRRRTSFLVPANSSFSSTRSLGAKGRIEALAHHFGVVDGRSVVVKRVLIKDFAILEVRVEECVPLAVALKVGPCPHRHSFEEL